jgi:hypothetical protein
MTKCARCGRDHSNDKPFNIKEAQDHAAEAIAKQIDQQELDQILRKATIRSGKVIDKGRLK